MTKKYKRVLLKLSGGQLAGGKEFGIDPEFVSWLAGEIKQGSEGIQLVIVVGGGNFLRGADFAGNGIERATADYMGMISTILNGMALADILESHGIAARLQTTLEIRSVAEPFIRKRALRHLEKGRVVIVAGGLGKPYLTTDTTAVTIGLELGCDVVIKATDVDGVFNSDPDKNKDAKQMKTVDHATVLKNPKIKVMEKAAIGLAMEHKLPIIVYNVNDAGSLKKIVDGEAVGTLVSS